MTQDKLTFGKAQNSDIAAIKRLYLVEAINSYFQLYSDQLIRAGLERHFEERSANLLQALQDPNQYLLLARRGGQVEGMAGYSYSRHLVHSVYVQQSMRSQGIGKQLMEFLLTDVEARPVSVLVADKNERALGFYRSLGFRQTGRAMAWQLFNGASIKEIELQRP